MISRVVGLSDGRVLRGSLEPTNVTGNVRTSTGQPGEANQDAKHKLRRIFYGNSQRTPL
jgi:hypothetical protein